MMFNSDLFFFLGIGAAGIQKSAGSALHEILSWLIRTWRDSHAIIQAINSHRQGCPRSAIAKLLDPVSPYFSFKITAPIRDSGIWNERVCDEAPILFSYSFQIIVAGISLTLRTFNASLHAISASPSIAKLR